MDSKSNKGFNLGVNEGDTSSGEDRMKQTTNNNLQHDGAVYALEDVSSMCLITLTLL